MADISQFKDSQNNIYNLKDTTARSGLNNKVDITALSEYTPTSDLGAAALSNKLVDLDDVWLGTTAELDEDRDTIPNNSVIFVNDDGGTSGSGTSGTAYILEELAIQRQIENGIYEGTDLTVKFADEIAKAPYNGNPWAWIQARTATENFSGIHICDYIPFTMTNGYSFDAQIMGINTYKNHGASVVWSADSDIVGSQIDWCTRGLYPIPHNINNVGYNNGLATVYPTMTVYSSPWLVTNMYYWLNSATGKTPNSTTVNQEGEVVDYTDSGIYNYLPNAVKNAIIDKYSHLQYRGPSGSDLSAQPATSGYLKGNMENCGKVWLPNVGELTGIDSFESGNRGYVYQYPYFKLILNRIKYVNGERRRWWILTPADSSGTNWYVSDSYGSINSLSANYNNTLDAESADNVYFPICFRTGTGNETS